MTDIQKNAKSISTIKKKTDLPGGLRDEEKV